MCGITNDGVGFVFEVAAYLVATARFGQGLNQRNACAGMARVIRLGPFQVRQAAQRGLCGLGRGIFGGVVGLEGVVHIHFIGQPAACQSQVVLLGGVIGKAGRQFLAGFFAQCKH